MRHHEHRTDRPVGPAGNVPPGQPAPPKRFLGYRNLVAIVLVTSGIGLGVIAPDVSSTNALFTSTAALQVNTMTAHTCLEPGEVKPPGSKLKKCPPPPPPSNPCKEDVLDSQSPASKLTDPIDTLPATLSAVYDDESAMDTTTNPPSLSIDGADQPTAWGTSLTVTADSSKPNDFHTTVSYTVPNSYADGSPHTFVITFHDTDHSAGCGVAAFYVQSQSAGSPPPSACQEDVLDKNQAPTPATSASNPITSLPSTLSVFYEDESPINTAGDPPSLTIDGVAQPGAALNVTDTSSGGDDTATVGYDIPASYADGLAHTFVITVYDTDHSTGCGAGTFYVKVPKP